MSFIQVSDALKAIRGHYRKFVYDLERTSNDDKRFTEFVERVELAEQQMAEAVSSILSSADESTLSTWLQFFPDNELTALEKDRGKMTAVDELVDHYSTFNKKLVDLFELVGRSTESKATRELFDALATVERQNARDLGWARRDTT